MNTRLQLFLASQGITQSQLADIVSVSPASISNILTGKNKPAYDFIHNILLKYPKLNAEWLIMGKGKMFKDDESPILQPEPHQEPQQDTHTPEMTTIIPEKGPFGYEQLIFPEVMQNIQLPVDDHEATAEETADKKTSEQSGSYSSSTTNNNEQLINSKHKAVRITVFYDDNTYKDIEL